MSYITLYLANSWHFLAQAPGSRNLSSLVYGGLRRKIRGRSYTIYIPSTVKYICIYTSSLCNHFHYILLDILLPVIQQACPHILLSNAIKLLIPHLYPRLYLRNIFFFGCNSLITVYFNLLFLERISRINNNTKDKINRFHNLSIFHKIFA